MNSRTPAVADMLSASARASTASLWGKKYQGYVQGPSCPKGWSYLLPSLAGWPTESFLKFVGQKMGQWDN
jgi:hypothetical protein